MSGWPVLSGHISFVGHTERDRQKSPLFYGRPKEIGEFTVQAYHEGAFRVISKADVLGKWAVFFFYTADFTFVCPTELEDLANKYADFQAAGCEVYSGQITLQMKW